MTAALTRRRFVQLSIQAPVVTGAALFAPMLTSHAQSAAAKEFFELLQRQNVETGTKIEVLEFFQYGCPHCAAFEPALEAWRKKLPADVEYRRNPVWFDEKRKQQPHPHQKLYYTLEEMKRLDLHSKVFNEIHVKRNFLTKFDDIAAFMQANGVHPRWAEMFGSMYVITRAGRANKVWEAYGVNHTPMLGIDGKFLTSPDMARSEANAIAVADKLIERARKERK